MPDNPFLNPILANWPALACLVVLCLIVRILRSSLFKGWFGEAMVNRGLRKLDPSFYRHFHDFYLPRPDGKGTTQIDHIVVSPYGIFVIETKNYQGWIFGGEKQRDWTQQIYRRKSRFQNPLHQNQLHIRALMDFLQLPENAFQSIVFFIGDSTFKSPMPDNVLNSGLRQWIENHRESILDSSRFQHASAALSELDRNTDRKAASRQHLRDLKNRRAA